MPSTAEVDLLVNATRTLPDLERDLAQVLAAAQAGADDIDVDAALRTSAALADISRDLDRVITAADNGADDIDIDAVLNQRATINALRRDLDGVVTTFQRDGSVDPIQMRAVLDGSQTLRDVRGELDTVIRAAQATAPDIDIDVDLDTDRLQQRLRTLTTSLGNGAGALTSFGTSATIAGSAVGALPGLIAGVVGAVQQIAPAAAVATTGLLAVKLATGAVQLGMIGVGDAVKDAFDPDTKPEDLAKQMERLAPEARKTVEQIVKLKSAFTDLQQDVQNRLFKDFDDVVKDLSTSVLPQLGKQLGVTATTLNEMGKGVGAAASQLGDSGVLGTALKSANAGLKDLTDIPGQAVIAFGELAAAAGPSFERITKAAAGVADKVSEQLTSAFKDGSLEDAIDRAVDAVAQLGNVFGNIFGVIGNLMAGVTQDGRGLFDTLEQITGALKDATGSREFQQALGELSKTTAALVSAVLPLLAQALGIVGEVIVAIAPSVRDLIGVLGTQFSRILSTLSPVIVALAEAFSKLLPAITPFIELAGDLIVALLPALTPLFENLGRVIEAATPFLKDLGTTLAVALVPLFTSLTPLLNQILPPLSEMAEELFPMLSAILIQIQPSLANLSTALGDLLVAVAPLIVEITKLNTEVLAKLLETAGPILVNVIQVLTFALSLFADMLSKIVLPAVNLFIDVLKGDYTSAVTDSGVLVQGFKDIVVTALTNLLGVSEETLRQFADTVRTKTSEAADHLREQIQQGVTDATLYVAELPDRISGALGDLGNLLYGAGQDIMNGLTAGIRSKVGDALSAAQDAANSVKDGITGLLDIHSPSRVTYGYGEDTMDGYINGIRSQIPDLETQINQVFGALPDLSARVTALDAPTVSVTPTVLVGVQIGNQVVDEYVTTRVETVNARDSRLRAQGVRR